MQKLERSLIACSILILSCWELSAQSSQVRQVKLTHFDLQSEYVIPDGGDSLSMADYKKKDYWFPVKVPCTVLSGLVANNVYPDPYMGLNNMMIPDASDYFNQQLHLEQYSHIPNQTNPWKKPYWYRTVFRVPAGEKGKHFQLIFKGINYRAEVWVNGAKIADSSQMAGMFADYALDVTNNIKPGDSNALAVRIFPLDFPGIPSQPQLKALGDFYANGGPFGDIGKNVTMLCSVGWDWIPEVRDRNMGIWQPVYLRSTGAVTIAKPQVITDLPDTSVAKLSIKFKLNNLSGESLAGKIRISISPENFVGTPLVITQPLSLDSLAESDIAL
ncbi:MAG TPA: beta galactosidase jelly roll domain-containing protein, partial [Puia sp.]|nr:beta galactosidase jelly roll domain-containing protein [Puia sp.]